MVIGMAVFWCFDKYQGYYLLTTGFLGTAINQFLKMLCRIPRPWVQDPNFTIVESAREAATGYSFPSGHTQTSVGVFAGLARWNKNTVLRIIAISACVLVPLSRMYLGVHTLLDVGVSIAIALVLIFVAYPLFKKAERSPRLMFAILGTITLLTLAYLLFAALFPFPADTDPHNLESAQKNGYTLFGCMLGLILAYAIDLKYTKFDTKAVWWAQLIKIVGGLLLVLAVKEGLRAPLEFIFDGHLIARGIRYFLMVVVGGILWPMSFKYFSKINDKEKEEK
jgi:undecaprenyl-diphosphatase